MPCPTLTKTARMDETCSDEAADDKTTDDEPIDDKLVEDEPVDDERANREYPGDPLKAAYIHTAVQEMQEVSPKWLSDFTLS
ncbi:hypothetical protein N7449_011873 [Penicillium cf. viridicatum]|uniref:Uncharacterized protein n=1 Tax=Penicillium cf. viridicatum TaxID=2972119 RepID=A0A9W9ITU4_9EURO|nr:hypothetical protein N7449_011873 [Penicillium cf. viridicatum]